MKSKVLLLTLFLTASFMSAMTGRSVIAYGESEDAEFVLKEAIEDLWVSDNTNPIAAGENHIVVIEDFDSSLYLTALGNNDFGQLDIPVYKGTPAEVDAGRNFSMVLFKNGTVDAWGENSEGQTDVPENLTNVVAIAAGYDHALALKDDGTVVAWGSGLSGPYTLPEGLNNIAAISAGEGFSLFLSNDGTVVAHGNNDYGQCDVPDSLEGIVAIAAGQRHSVALSYDGKVTAWGDNQYGQLDVPDYYPYTITAISAGSNHTLGLLDDQTVIAWGRNHKGQTDLSGKLEGMFEIVAGFDFSMAMSSLETEWWGNHEVGIYNTGWWIKRCDWLGPVEISHMYWLWCHDLNAWIYVPTESAMAETGWIYTTCPVDCVRLPGNGYIPWAWSDSLDTMLYVPEATWNANSGWVYVF